MTLHSRFEAVARIFFCIGLIALVISSAQQILEIGHIPHWLGYTVFIGYVLVLLMDLSIALYTLFAPRARPQG